MTRNPVFEKFLRLLGHPLSLAAMALMLFNDALLKLLWPSWWTGKLSDFAGLFFIPFLLAALLSWLIPGRNSERMAFALALGATAIFWIFAKLDGAFNTWLVSTLPIRLQRDPTDLLALLSLAGAGWLWWKQPRLNLSRPNALVLPLAALILLADAAGPDYGIACLDQQQGEIVAQTRYFGRTFTSRDGGLTWEEGGVLLNRCPNFGAPKLLVEVPDSQVQYRIQPDRSVERSVDGGQTWALDVRLRPLSEAERTYLRQNHLNADVLPVPLDSLYDTASGNLVLAMGHQGVLVRLPDGKWQAVAVGSYQPEPLLRQGGLAGYITLLGGEFFLALALALLSFGTLTLRTAQVRKWLAVLPVLGWLSWVLTALGFPPALTAGSYGSALTAMGTLASILLGLAAALPFGIRAARRAPRTLLGSAINSLAAALLFFLPFIVWVFDLVPHYRTAALIGIGLAAFALVAGYARQTGRNHSAAGKGSE